MFSNRALVPKIAPTPGGSPKGAAATPTAGVPPAALPQTPTGKSATASSASASSAVTSASNSGAVTRGRVGRDSNRLSKRVGGAGESQLKSKTLQTLESVCSTASQAEFASPAQTIIVFDWDDTLCPSHYIRVNRPALHYFQPCPNDVKYKVPLEQLSKLTIRTLRVACEVGKVIILTNAQPQWVEISCRNFLPGVWDVIRELDIDIIYAREGFENDLAISQAAGQGYNYNLNIPQLWKEKAMKEHITKFYTKYERQSWKNVISIGDQHCEHNAAKLASANRPSQRKACRVKTLKLLEEPPIEDLIAELQVIHQWLPGLVHFDGDLDADLSHDDDVIFDLHNRLTALASPSPKASAADASAASPTASAAQAPRK